MTDSTNTEQRRVTSLPGQLLAMASPGSLSQPAMNTQFKDHFSDHAAAYAAARPTYPAALFEWLASLAGEHGLAVDFATGNGQAACGLARHFRRVYASDASAQQLVAATAHPRVEYHCEPAEACGLEDSSADLITVAQAAHWLDHQRFYAEAMRVLTPTGVIAVWCYGGNRVEPAIDEVFDRFYKSLDTHWPSERTHIAAGYRTLPFPFDELTAPTFQLVCHWTCDEFLAYLRSWSASQRCQQQTGQDPVANVETAFRQLWGKQPRTVRWPLSLRVGRAANHP